MEVPQRWNEVLRGWLAGGAKLNDVEASRIKKLIVTPGEQLLLPGGGYQLKVEAEFADGSKEDVTGLCGYKSLDERTATVDKQGAVKAIGVGDAAISVRFRDEPVMLMALVTRTGDVAKYQGADAPRSPENFIDDHILAKLRRLKIPAADLAYDATFLRRVRLDVTGLLPTPDEVREFLADARPDKRQRKIDELLKGTGYADLWTLKFCDLLKAHDYGVYAQFVLASGGGFKRGCVVGATDKLGEQVTDKFYKVESFGRTLYHLLGIDPDTVMQTPSNRHIKLIAEEAPLVKEALV